MVKHECAQCKKAKVRIVSILQANPNYQNISTDDDSKKPKFPAQRISEFLPEKDYWPDVYCEQFLKKIKADDLRIHDFRSRPVIIEIDHESHKSDMSTVKDRRRDKHFLSKKIPTVRFDLKNIIGKRAWPDGEIVNIIEVEIEYQLK